MQNVLFVVNTEGHLLTTASLVFEKFNKTNGIQPWVLQVNKTGTGRFKNETDKNHLSEKYFEIDPADMELKKNIQEILDTKFEKVFIFLEQLSINVYLSNYFKKRGSIIALAPDGNKPYFTVDRISIGSRITQTIYTYKYLFARGLYYFRPYFLSWNYASLNPVDEIWVTYPDKYKNTRNKTVVGFTIMPDKSVVSNVLGFFKVDISAELKETKGIIFYTNNILYRQELNDFEIEILDKIIKKFPGTPFYLKYHPSTPKEQIKKFQELGATCFCNSKPAELYIASLKDSIVAGCWSAALMVNNPDCRFFWLHRYLIKEGKMVTDLVNLVNPAGHIEDIDNLDDIMF